MSTYSKESEIVGTDHDAWIQWIVSESCPMGCEYCSSKFPHRESLPAPTIDIQRALRTLERTGRRFKLQLTGGGEPFLCPTLIDLIEELTQTHQVEVNTNFVNMKMTKLIPRCKKENLSFIASCHIKVMEKKGLLDRYMINYHACRDAGISVCCRAVAFPGLIPELPFWKSYFERRGIPLEFNPYVGEYEGKRYPDSYEATELTLFGLPPRRSFEPLEHHESRRLCNAGFNTARISLNGDVYPCAYMNEEGDHLGNIYERIEFNPHIMDCSVKDCACPYYLFTPDLWNRAQFLDREHIAELKRTHSDLRSRSGRTLAGIRLLASVLRRERSG